MAQPFMAAHAAHPDWQACVDLLLAQWGGRPRTASGTEQTVLGIVYVGAPLGGYAGQILERLIAGTGVADWVGTVAASVLGTGAEYHDEPAIAAMIAVLPPDSVRLFSGLQRPPSSTALSETGALSAASALVHLDPELQDTTDLVQDLAGKVHGGRLFGGLSSGDAPSLAQFAGGLVSGGVSGAMFSSDVTLKTRVTQGCAALASPHRITACDGHFVMELDHEPALDIMLSDLGVAAEVRKSRDGERLLAALPSGRLRNGLFAGVADQAIPGGFGFGDYRVRNVAGIDPHNRLIAIADQAREGGHLVFCTRDAGDARRDLIRVITEMREEIESEGLSIRGGVYISCLGRGPALFGASGVETALLKANLGDFPLVGFYASGEIAGDGQYGHTGVLTLFT